MFFAKPLQRSNLCASHRQRRWLTHGESADLRTRLGALAEETESADLLEILVLIAEGRFLDAKDQVFRLLLIETEKSDPDWTLLAALLDLSVESRVITGEFNHPDVLAMAERAVQVREGVLSGDQVSLAGSLSQLARVFFNRGQYQRSRELLRRANAIIENTAGPDDPVLAKGFVSLGEASIALGDYTEALDDIQRALSINERAFGPEAHVVAWTLDRVGLAHMQTGNYVDAKTAFDRTLDIAEKVWGSENPYYVIPALNNVAGALLQIGDFDTARELIVRAERLQEKLLRGATPQEKLTAPLPLNVQLARRETMRLRALLLSVTESDSEAAVELARRSLASAEALFGEEHPEVANGLRFLANSLLVSGATDEAVRLYERALVSYENSRGPHLKLVR